MVTCGLTVYMIVLSCVSVVTGSASGPVRLFCADSVHGHVCGHVTVCTGSVRGRLSVLVCVWPCVSVGSMWVNGGHCGAEARGGAHALPSLDSGTPLSLAQPWALGTWRLVSLTEISCVLTLASSQPRGRPWAPPSAGLGPDPSGGNSGAWARNTASESQLQARREGGEENQMLAESPQASLGYAGLSTSREPGTVQTWSTVTEHPPGSLRLH